MSGFNFKEEYGVVIVLDVLGIKGIWKSHDPKKVLEEWQNFTDSIKNAILELEKKTKLKPSFNLFSDTIIMTFSGDIEKFYTNIGSLMHAILDVGMIDEYPLRGAISLGPFYKSDQMIIGPAIDECSQFYEIADCMGIIVTPSFHSFLERKFEDKKSTHNVIYDYTKGDIPIKDGKTLKNSYILTFDDNVEMSDYGKTKFPKFNTIRKVIHFRLEHLDSVEASTKLKNTLDMMNLRKKKIKK